ncbi:putative bifunctional diguanylate cyclase/phosphodiesterase [Clostridium beijerinckii]|uniref:putative bifunctional diguanylate cyclase/phosphodiesterase n=1 Tax=Clostridium beijerinckii TaxID=1520 RepID=UPI00098C1B24|nr:bifunctional diguanylate cyclase/phosphodiesterase [Clostridium beijerinckii]MBA8932852.1 diguanylate cyclase (GGDEF)-like protein [Clostridium beijerinckii]NRT37198.1 diguanylate cyclase (GGDEF)-like protein [Clostridium beijerinckii]NRT43368.1 diguanylate cyclase (GGDEF)-like protein [Clostridium beijerinckii]NRU37055.1 diguanylate cyclase (GGDEF)-like protein [Clostridium beijerinckii]NRZ22642.1 diguanylate cyclase (GGDEF)-like protein [Clostridium beijerinckii]
MNKIKFNMPKKELKLKMKMVKSIKRKLNKNILRRRSIKLNEEFSKHDILTGLPNSAYFFEKLNSSLEMSKVNCRKGAIIYIDVDDYKIINYNWGYSFGDFILKCFSERVSRCIKGKGKLFRLNGDEFAILIYEFKSISEIEEICKKIYKNLSVPFKIADDELEISVSISMGISTFPDDSTNSDELLEFCNLAMYKSKRTGKNNYTFFTNEIFEKYYREALIRSELKNAISKHELNINYQPQIDFSTNDIVGIEALLRWSNDKLGNVSPAEFIPIAEENGDIVQIGDWVMEKSIEQASLWKCMGYKFNNIAVNISPIQIKEKDFKDKLLKCCNKYNISPNFLEIEITESTLLDISEENVEVLNELKGMGINVAIDDFGTGYSSLSYLINISVSTLKIDKTFVDHVENYKNMVLIKNIVNLSNDLKYKVIVEGVETREQIEVLTDLGCKIIQGYYFSKPLTKDGMKTLLDGNGKNNIQ